MTSVMALDGVTSFYASKTSQIYATQSNYWREWRKAQADEFKCIFVVYCMLQSNYIDQPYCVNCWVIINCLSVSCTKINHSHYALVI